MKLETSDLATLPDLNEEILLEYVKTRYTYDIIYVIFSFLFFNFNKKSKLKSFLQTYIGDILLAINPFKTIPIYDQLVILTNSCF